ncbi:MAG: xanthine dehydrogenase family protein subunit M, partial [Candidatus Latescibacteria bacterium]|nr:xanthine dehydrogenase family protein subunit M [Candidatus Latescibacterota bacterium]
MRSFDYIAPRNIRETVEALAAHENAMVLAGGTDVLVRMKSRVLKPDVVVDIKRVRGLDELHFDRKTGLTIGAAVTLRQVELDQRVWRHFPALAQGVAVIGSIQIRNLATVVGNICNAAPSADSAPGLIALGAKARIAGPAGRRTMKVENLLTGPGETALRPGELVTGIQVPMVPPRTGSAYARQTPRMAMDIAVVGVGAAVTLAGRTGVCEDARIVMGAVAPTPLRAREAEKALRGKKPSDGLIEEAAERAADAATPISDVRGSAGYRRKVVKVLVR